ncbi:glycoside hydrolase family 16 protein [Labedaea rhizosphaerae]|uniref:Glycosyl hydrolase family 16 n=1 Tax=Labedaea rhizosphaerae TaxID=598644 RepID=A0A4R6SGX2_LABRH|nr:glycoside hydrolase family 16 protein [Labedaea rhizosphaerae]TDQ00873.1 glycosyl hydrolase family 16 [Labedaea rhizosphaerae]
MRRWSVVASAVVVVGAAAGFAVVSTGVSGAADGNLAANPVLAGDAQGWGVLSGGSGARVAVSDHPSAQFAYQVRLSGTGAGIYLPQQAVTGGASYTIAVDTKTAGTAHMQMDWYGPNGFIGSSAGRPVVTNAGSWTTVSARFTAPSGATNSHPLEYVTGASGTWLATNADYETATSDPGDPGTGDGDTAAGNYGWGSPLPASDEFDYTGAPDQSKWGIYGGVDGCGPGHAGNGQRCGYTNTVQDGYLRQTGYANGDTAGIAMRYGQRYGRWEVRARITTPGGSGYAYHPVLITWPDSDEWPQGGEYDYFEVNVGDSAATAFLHHPTDSGVVQDEYHHDGVDLSQWHNYGFEWAPDGLTGYLDGQVWFHDTDPDVQAPGPMHQTIQLDNFCGCAMQAAYFDVDWARVYALT